MKNILSGYNSNIPHSKKKECKTDLRYTFFILQYNLKITTCLH